MTSLLALGGISSLGWIPHIVLAMYLLFLLTVGYLGYCSSDAGEEDYYLAGRSQGWIITTLTIIATFLSSFALMGAPGMVYREGVVFALVSLNAPVAGFCIYLFGSRIWRIGRENNYVTQADMICDYYRSPIVLRLLVAFVGMMFVIPYVMMQIKAGGDLAAVLFREYDHSFEVGAVVLAAITALYVMIGGMRSVAWTDAVQCVLLLGGMVLAGVAMISSFGGLSEFSRAIADLPERSLTIPGNTGLWQWPFLFTVCLLMPIGSILQPAQWMRFYSARDEETLRRCALIFIIVVAGAFLFGIMPVGLGGQALFPLETTPEGGVAPSADVGSYDQILVVILKQQLPELLGPALGMFLASLFLVAIMAASMSTADSNLHALSAVLTRDIYDKFVRPSAGQSERVWVGRSVILLVTTASLVFVMMGHQPASSLNGFMEMIVGMALFAVAFSVQLLPITIDMLYWKRGTRMAAILGLSTGVLFAFMATSLFPMFVDFIHPAPTFNSDTIPPLRSLLNLVSWCKQAIPIHATAWGLIPNAIIFVNVSLLFSDDKNNPSKISGE
ncbi:MAG: sodium:solute symporter family protein [Planctomycetaceae bacterium]|jgi:solute:Na+ symporter, SSS family|nr:sodium:solute symporter family protein [Planctomycetaceae bacterium]MDB4786688.1 sodium:solute symporter family protein [Planctomycetaceae bacterium]MDC0273142.1 sodium:solute symporter family protein [Planctomycetaceae bacterium]MDG2390950.1 sodium:solute symporter family protein [Planctomycetaceae bacterium]